MPAAKYDSTSPTVMRVPRTQGLPKRTLWSTVMRSRRDDESDLRPSGYHFALFLPFSRHNSRQLGATRGVIPQVGNLLTPLE